MPRATLRRRPAAGFAAALIAGVLACAGAIASAAPAAAQDGVSRVERGVVPGVEVELTGGERAPTMLYRLRVDDETSLSAYGAALAAEPDNGAPYVEAGWGSVPVGTGGAEAGGPVTWIVNNSYPALDLEQVRSRTGAGDLTEEQAIAATQGAVWHYTDGAEPAPAGGGNDPGLLEAYDFLVAGAEGHEETAAPTLSVTPDRISEADPALPIGPMTVSTTGTGPVSVSVRGASDARLTDGEGRSVGEVADGGEFYLRAGDAAGAGVATVYASTTATVEAGRPFVGRDGVTTLPMVTAESGTAAGTATVKADWSAPSAGGDAPAEGPALEAAPVPAESGTGPPAPSPSEPEPSSSPARPFEEDAGAGGLALTGTWLGGLLGIGALLVVGGAAALLLSQRRNRRR